MEKIEFQFQYYYWRWICALPCLVLAILLNGVIIKLIQQEIWVYILCAIMMIIFMKLYYYFTQKYGWFNGKGYYWVEDKAVYIQMGKKTIKVDLVRELLGEVVEVYSNCCAMLFVDTGKKKYKLFSVQLENTKQFKASSIYGLDQLILDEFDLQPVKVLNQKTDYWYKSTM